MITFASFLLGLFIGRLRSGRFKNLVQIEIKLFPLLILALIIRAFIRTTYFTSSPTAPAWGGHLFNLANLSIIVFLFFNLHLKGIKFILAGSILNSMVIFLNGGQMPISLKKAEMLGLASEIQKMLTKPWYPSVPVSPKTTLPILGDVIPFKPPVLFNNLISLGDLLILVGIFWLVQAEMQHRSKHSSSNSKNIGIGRLKKGDIFLNFMH